MRCGLTMRFVTCAAVAAMGGCTSDDAPGSGNAVASSAMKDARGTSLYLAINGRTRAGPLPMGQTRGRLTREGACIVFRVRDQAYAPIWPAGTVYAEANGRSVIRTPGGQAYMLRSEATLGGGAFSTANTAIVSLTVPLPRVCPEATYVVQD